MGRFRGKFENVSSQSWVVEVEQRYFWHEAFSYFSTITTYPGNAACQEILPFQSWSSEAELPLRLLHLQFKGFLGVKIANHSGVLGTKRRRNTGKNPEEIIPPNTWSSVRATGIAAGGAEKSSRKWQGGNCRLACGSRSQTPAAIHRILEVQKRRGKGYNFEGKELRLSLFIWGGLHTRRRLSKLGFQFKQP